jgi:hypothetical protein
MLSMETVSEFDDCVFHHRGDCNAFPMKKGNICQRMVPLSSLDAHVEEHGEDVSTELPGFTERSLVMNRMCVPDVCQDNDLICPHHRYAFGIFWRPSLLCQSPYHRQAKPKATHCVGADMASKLIQDQHFKGKRDFKFPIGQKVCARCAAKIKVEQDEKLSERPVTDISQLEPRHSKLRAQEQMNEMSSSDVHFHSQSQSESESQSSSLSSLSSSHSMFPERMALSDVNSVLTALSNEVQPLMYQIRQPIDKLSIITIRELKRQYKSIMREASTFISEAMAPGQGQDLLDLFEESKNDEDDEGPLDATMESLLEAYRAAPNRKWKLLLLSTVPTDLSRERIQQIFDCTRYMVDKSRSLQRQNAQFDLMNPCVRRLERLDKHRLEFFFDFLFSSGLIQDVAHGTTFMKFDRGDKVVVPHVVRTVMKTHIFQLYKQHCHQTSYSEPLSRSTVLRLLDICKMRSKKTMCGLDSFVVDGNAGFDTLQRLIKELVTNCTEEKNLLQLVVLSRNYLKVEHRQHVAQDDSACATHCRIFALSQPMDRHFKATCNHLTHSMSCVRCNSLLALLRCVEDLVNNMKRSNVKDESQFDFTNAKADILSWMFHNIRSVQQDRSKQYVMAQLDTNSGLLLSDWAMKVLPQAHREKMDAWFGKRGISLHVDVLFYKDSKLNLKKMTYFTAIDRSLQDMSSVLCVFEHVLKQIKQDLPHLNAIYTRSDNAGCYAGAAVVMARPLLAAQVGIQLKRTDFNEPQRGKDQADRDTAVAKSCLRAFINRGGNLTCARSIKEALDGSLGALSGAKTSVIFIEEAKCHLPTVKVDGITKFHSVEFCGTSAVFWQYFDIGKGKPYDLPKRNFISHMMNEQPFSDGRSPKDRYLSTSASPKLVYFCPEDGCSATFDTEASLVEHEQNAAHVYVEGENSSTRDRARQIYIEHLRGNRILEDAYNKTVVQSVTNPSITDVHIHHDNDSFQRIFSTEGYAIRQRQRTAKITLAHRSFFQKLFDRGANDGKKVTAEKAFDLMRSTLDSDSCKRFRPDQYLTKSQIRSLFGRMTIGGVQEKITRRSHNHEEEDTPSSNTTDTLRMKADKGDTSSDEEHAEHYFTTLQDQEQDSLVDEEINNALVSITIDANDMDDDTMNEN